MKYMKFKRKIYWVAELNAALCLVTRARKWKDYIFHFLEWESKPQPVALQLQACSRVPQLALIYLSLIIALKNVYRWNSFIIEWLADNTKMKQRGVGPWEV